MKELAKKSTTLFLRASLIGAGFIVLGLCALILPAVYQHWAAEFPDIAKTTYLILFGLSANALAFFIALYHGWKVLDTVDKNKAFSKSAVRALGMIKKCLLVIAGFFVAGWPIIAYMAELEDAPGLILIYGTIFIGAPSVFAIGLAVLQRLLQSAIDIKSENDLTV